MTPTMPNRLLLLLALLLLPLCGRADIYKWVDGAGVLHYTDQPPTTGRALEVLRTLPPAPTVVGTPKSSADLDLEFRKRRQQAAEAEAKAQKDQTAQNERKGTCDAMQNRIRLLESGQRLAKYDEKGEPSVLDDEARAKEIDDQRRQIDAYCR